MVAFAPTAEPLTKTSPRARGQDRSYVNRSSPRTNSASQANLREAAYVGSVRLGTCSKDPIAYYYMNYNLYQYVTSSPLNAVDPSGMRDEDHHNFPQSKKITDAFSEKCLGTFQGLGYKVNSIFDVIDEFTTRWPDEVHRYIHNDLDYNNRALKAIDDAPDCCGALKNMADLIYQTARDAAEHFWGPAGGDLLPMPIMHPYRGPPPGPIPGVNGPSTSNHYFDKIMRDVCKPPPCDLQRAPETVPYIYPVPLPIVEPEVETVCVAVGSAYVCYKVVRTIPSLFPPLWPTLPANIAIP